MNASKKLIYHELHQRALTIAERYRRCEFELLEILKQIDQYKVFAQLGYSSLFDYAVRALKLSEANASNFITVARKSVVIPELSLAIEAGELSVATARKITPVVNKENSLEWIEKAKALTKLKLEKEVARIAPKTAVQERAKFVQADRVELKMGVSESMLMQFKRAQDLVSQKTCGPADFEATLGALLDFYLERNDPVKKAQRNVEKNEGNSKEKEMRNRSEKNINAGASVQDTRENAGRKSRAPIPAQVKHQIQLRDQGQCTHVHLDGRRCENKRWLELHHLKPVSEGGMDTEENLTTLCSAHHKQLHK